MIILEICLSENIARRILGANIIKLVGWTIATMMRIQIFAGVQYGCFPDRAGIYGSRESENAGKEVEGNVNACDITETYGIR